jgi:hypothetical protein
MQMLPTEMVLGILQSVNKDDLKCLRLVSRRLNDVASPLLFKSVNASHSDKDIKTLGLVAEDETISGFVQEIVYSETRRTGISSLELGDRVKGILHAVRKMPNVQKVILDHCPAPSDPAYKYVHSTWMLSSSAEEIEFEHWIVPDNLWRYILRNHSRGCTCSFWHLFQRYEN